MLLGDWCHSWPKVFITYPGMSPRFWSVVLQESEVTISPPLPQLPPTWKSNRRKRPWCDWGGRSSFLSPEAESVLEWCLGFPQVSQASPEAPPTNRRGCEATEAMGFTLTWFREFCKTYYFFALAEWSHSTRPGLNHLMYESGDSRIKAEERREPSFIGPSLHASTCAQCLTHFRLFLTTTLRVLLFS